MKKITLAVQWVDVPREDVPMIAATGLEILAVNRFIQFIRRRNPNHARYSPTNEGKRPAAAVLSQFS
jgi:hypothetical protein